MTPPTEINGTDITGATIDGQEVQEITVDGNIVFTAGPTIIDDFEDGDISEYSGDTGSFEVNSDLSFNGTQSLVCTVVENEFLFSTSITGPTQGDTFKFYWFADDKQEGIFFFFGTNESSLDSVDGYAIKLERINFNQGIFKFNDGSGTELDFDGSTIADNRWYEVTVGWGTDGSINVNVVDTTDDSQTLTMSATDTTYTSGGIAYRMDPFQRIDYVHLPND